MIDSLGGYRLLRTIGVGPRAEVFLAHPLEAEADSAPVVIKVYGGSVSAESVMAEVEALHRAAGDHVVRVLDVTSTPHGAPALVLARHATGSLARLLGDRAALEPGEAITLLAPLAAALARMHSAGVAHGGVGPGAVLFDPSGSPTLACFGRATLFAPGLPAVGLEGEQAVLADVLDFGSLATAVLERAGASSLAHRARTEAAPGAWLGAFADSLFELAEPLPVGLRARAQPEPVLFPSRVIAAVPALPAEDPAVPRWREVLRRARESLARVRRSVWIAAGGSLAALLAALVVIPQSHSVAAPDPPAPTAAPEAGAATPADGPVTADDPVAATVVLLAAREACIRELSAECLDQVDQPDSSALRADRDVVRAILDGEDPPPLPVVDGSAVTLTQRLGDSALVSIGPDSEPASVLLVKGEAGWRIRDYLEW